MGEITAADVAKLRELTGAGMMDAKKALVETAGDLEKAADVLRKSGIIKAGKKAERATNEGRVHAYIHGGGKVGTLVEVLCETDFVARTAAFIELCNDLAMHIAAAAPESVDDLLKQPYVRDEAITIENYMKSVIAKVGENIKVGKFTRYQI